MEDKENVWLKSYGQIHLLSPTYMVPFNLLDVDQNCYKQVLLIQWVYLSTV